MEYPEIEKRIIELNEIVETGPYNDIVTDEELELRGLITILKEINK